MALQSIADKLIAHTPPGQFRAFALTMLRRMAEIDPHEDAPDGDNYNELWDAIIDELLAAMEPRL